MPSNKRRNQQLDFLRGAAILLVLGNHLPGFEHLPNSLQNMLSLWRRGGWAGVDLFFVLSGFLVSGLLFSEYKNTGQIRPLRFLIRRGFKIYPGFYVYLACAMLFAFGSGTLSFRALVGDALFVQNYVGRLYPHTWSLAVEEHFYLLLCTVFAINVRRQSKAESAPYDPFRFVPIAFALCALLCLGLRIARIAAHPAYDFHYHFTATHLRLDALLFGVLLSYIAHFHRGLWSRILQRGPRLMVAGVVLFAAPFCFAREEHPWLAGPGLTVIYIASGCLLIAMLGRGHSESFFFKAGACIGYYSYSIYLWHFLVYDVCLRLPDEWRASALMSTVFGARGAEIAAMICYLAGSIAVGILLSWRVELPMLRLRDRFFPSHDADRQQAPEEQGPERQTRAAHSGYRPAASQEQGAVSDVLQP